MPKSHDGKQLQCEKCDYQSASKHSLKLHTHSKHDGIGYACGDCGHQATRKQSLKSHMASKHGGTQLQFFSINW